MCEGVGGASGVEGGQRSHGSYQRLSNSAALRLSQQTEGPVFLGGPLGDVILAPVASNGPRVGPRLEDSTL